MLPKVGIIKSSINQCNSTKIKELLELIEYTPKKEKILLKPNIVTDWPGETGVITHPKVTEAICDYFIENGYDDIIIGEGSGFFFKDHHWEFILKSSKYEELSKKPEVTLINLESKDVEREPYEWKYGTLKLPKYIRTHEYINLPTMKTHTQTKVTLGCKNQKGLLKLSDKKNFHRKELNPYILEFNRIIKPDLTIMDAIYCLEGNGPALNPTSNTVEMDLIVASTHTVALDNACCEIMGFQMDEIPSIPKAEYQIIGIPIKNIKRDFKPATSIIFYDNIGKYATQKTCTACNITDSQMMRKIEFTEELNQKLDILKAKYKFIYNIYGEAPNIEELETEENIKVLCFGNCSKEFAEKHGYPCILGCPPDYHEAIEFLLKDIELD